MRSCLCLVLLAATLATPSVARAFYGDPAYSETMQQAMRHYDEEHYARAEPLLLEVAHGRTPDPPAVRQRAEFILGKTFFNTHRYREARTIFVGIAHQGADHGYQRKTLLWLTALLPHCPGDAELTQTILGYEREVLDLPALADGRDAVLLIRGKLHFQARRFAAAAAELSAISGRSQEMIPGLFWQGMSQICQGDLQQAASAFRGVLRRADEGRYVCEPRAYKEVRVLAGGDADAMHGVGEMEELVVRGGAGNPVLLRHLCP